MYKEHGDGVHPPSSLYFKDLRASWAMCTGVGTAGGRGRGGGRRVGEENLDFLPDGVGQPRFSLAPEPPIAPSASGSASDRRAEKRAEPTLFGILGV